MRSMPSRIAKLTALFSIGFPILIDDDLSILQFRGDPAFDTTVIALCRHFGYLVLIELPYPFCWEGFEASAFRRRRDFMGQREDESQRRKLSDM